MLGWNLNYFMRHSLSLFLKDYISLSKLRMLAQGTIHYSYLKSYRQVIYDCKKQLLYSLLTIKFILNSFRNHTLQSNSLSDDLQSGPGLRSIHTCTAAYAL
jgi:hypothetical protein